MFQLSLAPGIGKGTGRAVAGLSRGRPEVQERVLSAVLRKDYNQVMVGEWKIRKLHESVC